MLEAELVINFDLSTYDALYKFPNNFNHRLSLMANGCITGWQRSAADLPVRVDAVVMCLI